MLIYDLADPQELQGFVRGVQEEADRNPLSLAQFLPNDNIDDIEYKVTKGGLQDEDAAFVRAWDTESPIGTRQGLERMFGELPPISKKIPLTEEQRLRRRALERGDNQAVIDAIFNDAAKMARAVVVRVEMFRAEALFDAAIDINENGVDQDIPFGRSASHDVVPAVNLWSNVGASTPIQDEQAWLEVYNDTNGFLPGLALTSNAVVNNLLLNAQYRSMAAQNGITPPFLNLAGLNQIRATYDLPPLVRNDSKVRVNGVQTRLTPVNELLYLPPAGQPLGRTLFGTTAEALELNEAQQISTDQAPGLVSVVMKTFDPVITWTKAAAISLPVIVNPDFTMRATVQ